MATASEGSPAPRGLVSTWNFFVKYAPAIVVLIGGGWQLTTYLIQRHDTAVVEARRQRLEAQKPFFEKQFALYLDAAKATGLLATLPLPTADGLDAASPNEDWAWARQRFWQLFWNELPIVEDKGVESAMGDFRTKLEALEQCIEDKAPSPICKDDQAQMQGASKALADAIGSSIKATWRYDLPP